jgi:DNA helicase-2/ATP-dependent DNA helicase PcrA
MEVDPAELLTGLDEAQREAVTHPGGPLCIVAGAGSGKTRVLTRRIAWRCATGATDARKVLALTFTRAAAAELTARLRMLGLRDGVRAGTFHAVAWAELRARAADVGRTPPVLLDRPARLLAKVVDIDRRGVAGLAAELAWARARAIPLERYPAEAARAGRATGLDPQQVVEAGVAYAQLKRRRGVVDFDDLLEHLATTILQDPSLAATQRFRFAHLYVDELQDLNPLQHRLLEAWRGGRDDLTAVGDANQAVYGWNGSDPAFVESFTDLYPGASVLAIERNHRSTEPILDLANSLLDAGGLGGVRLVSVRGEGPVPTVHGYADDAAEARAIARAVLDAKGPGRAWGHQAVLARTNALLGPIEAAMAEVGIPVRVRGRLPFHEQPVVRAALRELGAPGRPFLEGVAVLATRLPGGEPLPGDDLDDEARTIARLVDLADRFAREHRPPDAAGFRAWLLTELDDAGEGDAVDLLTFHAAKGREWPVVHVCGLEEGLVPIARARTAAARTEERRLLYVACTRAERHLHLTWAARRSFGDGAPVERRPSPFLADLAPTLARLRSESEPVRPTSVPRPAADVLASATPVDPAAAPAAALHRWRETRSRAAGVPPTSVLPDHVLTRLARERPVDRDHLRAIPGTGPLLLAGHAEEILALLRPATLEPPSDVRRIPR